MKIALLPGDGIGPEVLAQARKVLEALRSDDFAFDAVEAPAGGAAIVRIRSCRGACPRCSPTA